MIGVYLIKNKINGKCYVGASKDIYARWKGHQYESNCPGQKGYNKALYRAFRKYGIDNFHFAVLEECKTVEEAFDREPYWIEEYNSLTEGYNEVPGGNNVGDRSGENNGRAKLTEQDVINIRIARKNKESRSLVYEKYKDKLTFLSFVNVWQGVNWKHIMPEIYTPEYLAKENRGKERSRGERNVNSKLTEKDVSIIRQRKINGEIAIKVYQDYKDIIHSTSTFYNVWNNKTWKHVVVEEEV